MNKAVKRISLLPEYIWSIGYRPALGPFEKRKLGIFNFINVIGIVAGISIPVAGLVIHHFQLPSAAWIAGGAPAAISAAVLLLNRAQRYEMAQVLYFTMYPLSTSLIYALRADPGIEFFFVLYAVLSVFFLKNIYSIIFCFTLSVICFLALYDHSHLFLSVLALMLVFVSLLLIRHENIRYQEQSRDRNWQLRRSNLKILRQKADITGKATLLEEQTQQLTELNSLKSKLFSVIAHDLKAPLYAVRNLFRNIQLYDLPGDEIKRLVPEVISELNYTTGLMENLLQWAKSQMQAEEIRPQLVDIAGMAREVLQLLRLQADAKKIYIDSKIGQPIFVYADKDMINLVLRNLLSNAIKFTPMEGSVFLDARDLRSCIEVSVQDTGMGISQEGLRRLKDHNYYSTRGTGGEAGTGLGLMLCKEFLSRNGGQMNIESELGKGSTFSFTLPKGAEDSW